MRKFLTTCLHGATGGLLAFVFYCVVVSISGCDNVQVGNGAAVLPDERVAFPVSSVKLGEVVYVTAEALRLDKRTHKLYVYTAAPTFVKPANTANIALKRNDKGFDADLSANTDMFIPIDRPEGSEEEIITSVNAPPPAAAPTPTPEEKLW